MASKNQKKILWAVDAFQPEKEAQSHVIETLRVLSSRTGASILPAYVLSPDQLNLSLDFTGPWVTTYKPAVEKSLNHLIESSGLQNVARAKILIKDSASLKNSVRSLAAYAASQGAELIVAGTQGKRGLSRIVLGSFAESLLLYSKVPVLIVGPEAKPETQFDSILFPTDLGKNALAALSSIADFAKTLGAKIKILHAIPNPIEPVLQSGVYLLSGGWVPVPVYLEKEKEKRNKKAQDLVDRLQKKGIEASYEINTSSSSVTQAVLDTLIKDRMGLIAMAAQSGPVASALLGSITRQMVRGAPCPVWVVRPRAKK